MGTSEIVRQQTHRLFSSSHADDVIAALDTADLSLGMTDADRVHFAILLLSKGDMQRFRDALSQARQDWRDTLVAAEIADEDWPSILRQQGIEI